MKYINNNYCYDYRPSNTTNCLVLKDSRSLYSPAAKEKLSFKGGAGLGLLIGVPALAGGAVYGISKVVKKRRGR